MTKWSVEFLPLAREDFNSLDHSVKLRLKSALRKLETDPISYGDPLGERIGHDLAGLYSLRAVDRKIRVVYAVFDGLVQVVLILAVGARERMEVHRLAYERFSHVEDVLRELAHLATNDRELFEEILEILLKSNA